MEKYTVMLIFFLNVNRYQEATEKYEAVMKMETNVPVYTTRAKERICHCLSKVNIQFTGQNN